MEAILRKSYMNFVKHKDEEAISNYEKAYSKATEDKTLFPVLYKFCERVVLSLETDNFMKGIIYED